MITAQPVEHQLDKSCLIPFALQEKFLLQPTVLLGVISSLTGIALQEEIVRNVQQFHTRGQMILGMVPETSGGVSNDRKTSVGAGPVTARAGTVQLGGSPAGPPGVDSSV
jgi:hypothetical protein